MPTLTKIKPARKGLKVRHPVTLRHLKDRGEAVDLSDPYWRRRLRDGDVVTAEPETAPETTKPETAKPGAAGAKAAKN